MSYFEKFEGLDETDNKILDILRADARTPYAEIGKELGIARQTVKNRVDAMEERGIIKGYVTLVDVTDDIEAMLVLVDIDAHPEYFNDVIEYLQKDPMVKKLYQMTGGCRLHAMVVISSQRQLQNYVHRLRNNLMGVKYISYSAALSILKDSGGVRHYEESDNEQENK